MNDRTALSAEVQALTELRDTCTQYAAWMMRDLDPKTPEYRNGVQLYIEASAAANSYIESLRFDILVGTPFDGARFEGSAKKVKDSSTRFLNHAQQSLEINKTRGVPLIIPAAIGLIELASKLNGIAKAASERERELVAKSLGETKWKTVQELRPVASFP